MNKPNVDDAWAILIARKAEWKDNRTAFLAALILERVTYAEPKGVEAMKMTPFIAAAFAAEFVRLAAAIKSLCEADCSYGLNASQEKRLDNLKARFIDLAAALGFEARVGGDPRGACAYLIDPDNRKGDGWGDGWAVYK